MSPMGSADPVVSFCSPLVQPNSPIVIKMHSNSDITHFNTITLLKNAYRGNLPR